MSKNIVILGGGYGGIESFTQIADKKLNDVNLILISKSNFFYHNVASPRTLVQSSLTPDICIPFDNFVKGKNQQFIHGKKKIYICIFLFCFSLAF